jgi:hypothetical protein
MYLQTCGSFKSANHKKLGSTNRKTAKCQQSAYKYLPPSFFRLKFFVIIGGYWKMI